MTKTYAVIDTTTGNLVSISTEQPDAPKSRIITHNAFIDRLTDDEQRALYQAEQMSIDVRRWMDRFRMADEISLDDEDMVSGLHGMEQMGLLAAGRAAEVLK